MFRNYILEADLKGYVQEKDLLLWTGQTDYSAQKDKAEQEVANDFSDRGFRNVLLRPDLTLRSDITSVIANITGAISTEDTITRMRWAWNITAITVAGSNVVTLTLQGTNDKTNWFTVTTATTKVTGESSKTFINVFKFYRMNISIVGGDTITVTSLLTESNYDRFIIYKWLEIILWNAMKDPNDQYANKAKLFLEKYEALWNNTTLEEDTNLDGTPDTEESTVIVRMGR